MWNWLINLTPGQLSQLLLPVSLTWSAPAFPSDDWEMLCVWSLLTIRDYFLCSPVRDIWNCFIDGSTQIKMVHQIPLWIYTEIHIYLNSPSISHTAAHPHWDIKHTLVSFSQVNKLQSYIFDFFTRRSHKKALERLQPRGSKRPSLQADEELVLHCRFVGSNRREMGFLLFYLFFLTPFGSTG